MGWSPGSSRDPPHQGLAWRDQPDDRVLAQLPGAAMLGPIGEQLAPAEAAHDHNMVREPIAIEIRKVSVKHQLAPRNGLRDMVLLALDYPVLLYAMFGLLNINPALTTDPDVVLMAGIPGPARATTGPMSYPGARIGLRC